MQSFHEIPFTLNDQRRNFKPKQSTESTTHCAKSLNPARIRATSPQVLLALPVYGQGLYKLLNQHQNAPQQVLRLSQSLLQLSAPSNETPRINYKGRAGHFLHVLLHRASRYNHELLSQRQFTVHTSIDMTNTSCQKVATTTSEAARQAC